MVGIEAVPVEIEVDVAAGLPKTILVGLPELAVRESVHRIERALANLGYQRPAGPLLDRMDLHIEVPAVPYQELAARQDGTTSATLRDQVLQARGIQARRFGGHGQRLNSRMNSRQLRRYCALDAECQSLMQRAMEDLGLSARA